MVLGPLSVAHQIWYGMGENLSMTNAAGMPPNRQISLTKCHYSIVAKYAYQYPTAKVTYLQYEPINHEIINRYQQTHVLFVECGTVTSGAYNN